MSTKFIAGCPTKVNSVIIPNLPTFNLYSLQDQSQFCDPNNVAEQLGISSALWPLFGLLWPSAWYLTLALSHRNTHPQERILEIGCGLALPSLFSLTQGWQITASDNHPAVPIFLKENLNLNQLTQPLSYYYGHWGSTPANVSSLTSTPLLTECYDFIIGSDLLYEPNSAERLAFFINQHASIEAEVWIVDANRGYQPAFKRAMIAHGFIVVEKITLNQSPCLSGAKSYKGRLLKLKRTSKVNYESTY